ncbi:LamG-like jellyroll fold domain-containing protein [Streptomyces mirabilis]|uniref:LamG-like jellyroll fold domain-containing protein n=1 Tax=Streptomyces mirabilis TaxID=68239 RepID=UPI00224CE25F|nr:LamG-like jellyroll fold domain-containing protein [Streptomyces mirabilis]MCX4609675.1 polymorphic toxin-type HINT domain-containing protein [Streptomyces mirabilis]
MARVVVLLVSFLLAFMPSAEEAMAQGMTLSAVNMPKLSMSGLWDWLHSSSLKLPRQLGGSASGLAHTTSAAHTRGRGGRGHKSGRGKGELAKYARHRRGVKAVTTGTAAVKGRDGFNARTSRRDAAASSSTTDVFRNANGTTTKRVYFARHNFKASDGSWKAIDTSLVKSGGRWREKANDVPVNLAGVAKDAQLASVGSRSGHEVSYGLQGAAAVPGVTGADGTVTYTGVLPDTDLKLVPLADGVKEKLVLSSAQAPASWSFKLDAKGLTPRLADHGSVEFTGASGAVVVRIPHAFMQDSSVNRKSGEPATSRAVDYGLSQSHGAWILTMTADRSWLGARSRVWPVTVDPTLAVSDSTYAETGNSGDHSTEDVLKVGSYDSGTHSANSFLHLTGLTGMISGQNVTAANLHAFDIWAATCTAEPFYVSPISASWTGSAVTSYPGPGWNNTVLGQVTTAPGAACTNSGGSRTTGTWMTVPLDDSWFDAIAAGTGSNYGLAMYSTTTDTLHWKQFDSVNAPSGYRPYLDLTLAANTAPQIDASYPPDNYNAQTLTPELVAYGFDSDNYPGTALQYQFQLLNASTSAVLSDSGLISGGDWKVPSGKTAWGSSYLWQVRSYDGVAYSPWTQSEITAVVPQPAVTSGLSQNTDGHDFDPSAGNYTTSDTDADVKTVGPSLSVERDYNSLDPRVDGAFGAGWSTVADMEAAEVKDSTGAVVSVNVTYPDGSQVGFGKNADGSFTPPPGRWASLTATTSPAGYKLVDKDDTAYVFQQPITGRSGAYAVSSITDYAGRAETFTYTSNQLATVTSQVSGRKLNFTWSTPSGATAPHVATVATDAATTGDSSTIETWSYGYTGDSLTKVCPPTDATHCTTYGYAAGNHYRTTVLDADPFAYWRMGETSGTTAADGVDTNEGNLNGTYHNVTLGSTGPLTGSHAASFNGTTSYLSMPSTPGATRTYASVSLWFKTAQAGGVLFYYGDKPLTDSNPVANTKYNTPAIYIGTNGKLHGCFAMAAGCNTPIQSAGTVNNNAWHQVVLTSAGNTQSMYLDGGLVGSMAGALWSWNQPYVTFGAGVDTHGWPDMPADTLGHYSGLMAEASIFDKPLTAATVTGQYTAATAGAKVLQTITLPSGKTQNTVQYNPVDDTISQETDNNGGVWKLSAPTVTGSSQVYRSAVMGASPSGYWRLNDTSGSAAANEVNTAHATYNNVTLNAAGPFGSSDVKAASFAYASSSYASPGAAEVDTTKSFSVSAWVNLATATRNYTAVSQDGTYHAGFYLGYEHTQNKWALRVPTADSSSGNLSTQLVYSTSTAVTGQWTHLVATYDATSGLISLYVNGALQGTDARPNVWGANGSLQIGRALYAGNEGDYWDGSLGEVAVFRSALSAAQVSQEWTAYKSSSGVAPVRTVQVQVPTDDASTKYITYGYDVDNGDRVLYQSDALGNRTTYGYDTSGFLYTTTDPDGNTTTTGHDVRGNVVSKTTCQNQAQNLCETDYYTYYPDDTTANPAPDPRNDLLLTERDGRSSGPTDNTYLTSHAYDAFGNQTTVTSPAVPGFPSGRTTTTTYTTSTTPAADSGNAPAYLEASTITPGGATTSYTYNHNGDLAQQTSPSGGSVKFTYDNIGRQLTKTEISDSYPAGLTSTTVYDKDDQVVTETDPPVTNRVTSATHTARTSTVYDVDGNIVSQATSDLTGGDGPRRTEWSYDSGNRVATESQVSAFNADGSDKTLQSTTYTYDVYGNAVKEVDPSGNETDYTFDADNRQITTTQPGYTGDPDNPSTARTLTLDSRAYDPAGRLASTTDSMGFTTSYTYTDNGLVTAITRGDAVTDPNNPKLFVQQANTYDAAGNLTQQVTNGGTTTTTYAVDAASRTTATTVDPTGLNRTDTVSYDPDDHVVTSTHTGASGTPETTSYTYDQLGNPTSTTVHDGTTAPVGRWKLNETSGSSAADSSGANNPATTQSGVTWSTDHGGSAVFNGTSTSYAETAGPVVDTAGGYTVSAWVKLNSTAANSTFVSQNGTTTSAFQLYYSSGANNWAFGGHAGDTSSATWTAAYGGTPVVGQWTHLTGVYDAAAGQFNLYVNGALTGTKAFTTPWNGTGTLDIARKLSAGTWGEYANGSIADVQVYSEALSSAQTSSLYGGTLPAAGSTVHATRAHLDQRGLATWAADENGNVTSSSYDEAGNPSVVTQPTVNAETVDAAAGTSSVSASHPVMYSGYNTYGEVSEAKDANGNVTQTGYDPLGQQVSQTLPSYTPPGSSTAITPVTSTQYNTGGQITSETDALGNVASYTYDQLGDQVDETLPGGRTTHSTYDTNGDLLSATDPTGAVTQSTYDYLGHQLTSTDVERRPSQAAYTTTNHYDAPGAMLSSSVSPNGVTTSFTYNAAGEQTKVIDGANNATQYTYDLDGRQTKVTNPDNTYATTSYDPFGNAVGTAEYDSTGMARRTTSSAYDPAGNLTSATDGNGHTTNFTLDATGMVTKEVQPVAAGQSITTSFGYDAVGNRTRFTDGNGYDTSGNPVAGHDWLTAYNPWNLPQAQIEPSTPTYPAVTDRTYTSVYDADARVTQQQSPGGVSVTNTYDPTTGDLTRQAGTGAEATTADHTYGYDADGRVTSAAAPGSNDTFTYDDRGNLLSTGGPSGTSSFAYNGDGQMTSRTDAAGTSAYGYDTAGRLKTINDAATGSTATVSYNQMSLPSTISYGTGKASRTLQYDWAHRLTSDTLTKPAGGTEASVSYGYDLNDNETSKTTTGVAGAATNTYTYDWADRLASWNNGTTTATYGYDNAGNRTRVGGDTYTYNARNELTSDGHNTYSYTARGTLSSTTDESSHNSTTTADAFNRVIISGSKTYAYDGLDRMVTAGDGVSNQTFAYTGTGNDLASDGGTTYSRDPGGALVGLNSFGTKVLAMTDLHDDVVGQFTDTGTALTGSTTFDPFGKALTTQGMVGSLGYQSEWADPDTSQVDMAARWYNPNTGQFASRDTAGLNPVPDSVNADRFAYGSDNPLTNTDPTGHWSVWGVVKSVGHAIHHAASSAWHHSSVGRAIHSGIKHLRNIAREIKKHGIIGAAKHYARKAVSYVRDHYPAVYHYARHYYQRARYYYHRGVYYAHHPAKAWHRAKQIATHVGKYLGNKLHKAARATEKYIRKHAATIAAGAVFLGCSAAIGVETFGAGMVACAAAAGAVGNAVGYAQANKGHITAKGLLTSAGIGAVSGAVGALAGGAAGEAVAPVISGAVGEIASGIGARVASGATTGAIAGEVGGMASGASDFVGGCVTGGSCSAKTASNDIASGARDGAIMGGIFGGLGGLKTPKSPCHSFTAATSVLMATGTTKQINKIKTGDYVLTAAPGEKKKEKHRVDRVIITHTDHDFVDVTVATKSGPKTIHTTKHHQFYDATTNTWTQAYNLKNHDKLQNAAGSTTEILGTSSYTATQTTYDLTINGLHTYYVLAGATPVLVHNCGGSVSGHSGTCACASGAQPRLANGTMGSNPNAPVNRLDRSNQYRSGYSASTHQEMAKRWTDSSGNWLDEQGSVIPRNELTYDHAPPVVDHWNSSGYNSSRAARNDYYNDPDNLVPMRRGPNSSAGGSMTARYRQDTGPNYSP